MPQNLKYFVFFLLLFFLEPAFAQVKPVKPDSTAIMYKKIETYSKKRKFTNFVHSLIFEPMTPKKLKAKKKIQRKAFREMQGKIVRKINVVTLDPFGYSETDTTATPKKSLSTMGNAIHLKSKRLTILNLLLIKRNRPLDSLLVKESERLIRSQRYVRRVIITPKPISKESDSVDVDIRVLDSWSLIPDFAATSSKATYELTERNFLGLGHQVENTYRKSLKNSDDAYSVKYSIPNIMNTYIRTVVNYQIDLDDDYRKSINIERPFFSPYARWAAGVYFDQQFRTDTLPDISGVYEEQNFKFNTTDLWAGHAVQLVPGDSEDDRTTNFITAARFNKINYQESPAIVYDSINFYATESSYLFGLGISSRQFVEDRYLFNYGIVEDVPVGKIFGITGGFQKKNDVGRLYLGARAAFGKFYDKIGYLSTNIEYGSYFNSGNTEQTAFSLQIDYFTNLMETGKWKFRQFVKAKMIIGNDRKPSNGDRLTLNEDRGIQGFDTATLYGTKKMLLVFQTQSYAPWSAWGFRLNPYFNYTLGMLGDGENGFKSSKGYHQIGLGVLISNDYLVFSTFQLSFSFYPNIPNTGENIFKTNAYNSDDFGLQDFELAKPRTVIYE